MAQPPASQFSRKRLIVCCDGTWMNADSSVQDPSNVTRISRCFKRKCSDGTMQITTYESGVGTGSNHLDSVFGGAFGLGLSERVRECYSFICANYCDGDEIVLVGFSRGAFTVRSVAGMISSLGLLTREGMEQFFPIFKDMENWRRDGYDDPYPTRPFDDKPKGPKAASIYRDRLADMKLTRVYQNDGTGPLITVKAIAVWDTVGSLGIPEVSWLSKIGLAPDNSEYEFWDTSLSDRIEHAFQALALDETRPPFSPAVWERLPDNKNTTDLRQVWFPGNHGNCGGGWEDQGVSNLTLAWMMDQLASVGVEFDLAALERVVLLSEKYYNSLRDKNARSIWAAKPIFDGNKPQRPWGLGAIRQVSSLLYTIAGTTTRSPGMYKQVNSKRPNFLQDTNERVHSSVRVRLACQGLGPNDTSEWKCPALASWKLSTTPEKFTDPIPKHPSWEPAEWRDETDTVVADEERWTWKYTGDKGAAPLVKEMVEEPLGPFERHLLKLAGGKPNVYQYAREPQNLKESSWWLWESG